MSLYTIIAISSVIILSYLFNIFSRKTNIPSVLLLIILGVLMKEGLELAHVHQPHLVNTLEILGIVGLIMIVLEAALDLELKKEKNPLIMKSFLTALFSLVLSAVAIALAFNYLMPHTSFVKALVYAIPLSIMSSAIIIPSVGGLKKSKKEFMVYESTFSDILGIMFFYFLIGSNHSDTATVMLTNVLVTIMLTIVLSVVISYVMIIVLQSLTTNIKLYLLIAVLLLFYCVGKLFHLSSLLIILIFGLILNNNQLFFRGFLKKWHDDNKLAKLLKDFHVITIESAFVVKTLFFVIFGMQIVLASLFSWHVLLYSGIVIAVLYLVRFLMLKLFIKTDFTTELYIAPRGLITILLFYAIPHHYKIHGFDSGILLFTILSTSIIMAISLIRNGYKIRAVEEITNPNLSFDMTSTPESQTPEK